MASFSSFPVRTFSLPNFCFEFRFIQGRLRLAEMVTLGIHSSMIVMNFCSHISQALSTLGSLR